MLMEHENCPCMETCPAEPGQGPHRGEVEDADSLFPLQQRPHPLQPVEKGPGLGCPNTVLANALRELEGDGLVHRREYLEVPVRVEYAITEPCRQLIPILDALGDWSMAL